MEQWSGRQVADGDADHHDGRCCKEPGIVEALRRVLKAEIHVPEEPQIIGALGVALPALKLPSESVRNPKGNDG